MKIAKVNDPTYTKTQIRVEELRARMNIEAEIGNWIFQALFLIYCRENSFLSVSAKKDKSCA